MKKIINTTAKTTLLIGAFAAIATFASAKDGGDDRKEIMQDFRDDRREDRKDLREDFKQSRENLKEGVKMKRDFMFASTTATGTSTTTPWRDFKRDIKEMKKDFKQERKEDKKEMKDEMKDFKDKLSLGFGAITSATLLQNATITKLIADKLGISTTSLQAQIASGTSLQMLLQKASITKDQVKALLPKPVSPIKLFATNTPITITLTQGTTTFSTTTKAGVWGFMKNFFGI
jgi:gas vesicle protein